MPKKKKRLKKQIKKNQKNKLVKLLLFLAVILIAIFLIQNISGNTQRIADTSAKNSLQLGTFQFTDPPTRPPHSNPTNPPIENQPQPPIQHGTCKPEEEIINNSCTCPSPDHIEVYCHGKEPFGNVPPDCIYVEGEGGDSETACKNIMNEFPCKEYCVWKPIVYLYPEIPTLVDVKIVVPGSIVISDPLYPDGGWKNVLALPNGNLFYEGKQYRELFYESDVSYVTPPKTGMVIETKKIREKILPVLKQLGFNEFERNEFLEFWVPKLSSYKKPYVLFSILDYEEKNRIDKLIIQPEPDTRIEMIAYFKLLDEKIFIKEMILPNTPERKGFTIVEWGGVIEPE